MPLEKKTKNTPDFSFNKKGLCVRGIKSPQPVSSNTTHVLTKMRRIAQLRANTFCCDTAHFCFVRKWCDKNSNI